MGWFKRNTEGITTSSAEKKEIPEGAWYQCPSCKTVVSKQDHANNLWVCGMCDHHERIGSDAYFGLLFDEGKCREIAPKLSSADPLEFSDTKAYTVRLEAAQKKTGLTDAIRVGSGTMHGQPVVIACMDFSFIGGSMGSVVGEKFVRGIEYATEKNIPFVSVAASGGARMQEGLMSLMQMAKTTAALKKLDDKKIPYISILTDPTMGGVSASFAFVADVVIAEPNALIGFAGPRVIEQTVREKLPRGFQRSEFLLEKGSIDLIVDRRDLRKKVGSLLSLLKDSKM